MRAALLSLIFFDQLAFTHYPELHPDFKIEFPAPNLRGTLSEAVHHRVGLYTQYMGTIKTLIGNLSQKYLPDVHTISTFSF